jgi:hypothetical protein
MQDDVLILIHPPSLPPWSPLPSPHFTTVPFPHAPAHPSTPHNQSLIPTA